MNDVIGMFRTTLEFEGNALHTPDSCTINRALELVADAYQLGNQQSDERKLREQYAGMALVGYMSGVKLWDKKEEVAKTCVSYADALIAELKKGGVKE